MNIDHANRIPVAKILEKLPGQPKRISANKLIYVSPLHPKKAALFEVNTTTNRWYDHGHDLSGTPVDLVRAYLKTTHEAHTEADALRWLTNMVVLPDQRADLAANTESAPPAHVALRLKAKGPIQYAGLLHYLDKHAIPLGMAQRWLNEIRICQTQTKKQFLALGFANEEGGLEFINPFLTGCLGARSITFIRGQRPKPTSVHLFNTIMDYLSAISQLPSQGLSGDAIVLNRLSGWQQAIPYIQQYGYRIAYSWLNNDTDGQKATKAISAFCQTETGLRHWPMNKLYAPHQDVNAWHRHRNTLTVESEP